MTFNKFFLSLISMPFFVIGFIWSFAKQGFKDGCRIEEGLRKFYDIVD